MKLAVISVILVVLFAGCAGQVPEGKNCGTGKGCLKDAFKNCEKSYGTWQGENGEIKVIIKEKKQEFCSVSVAIQEKGLNISDKGMICDVPMSDNKEFSIASECTGELKDFFET